LLATLLSTAALGLIGLCLLMAVGLGALRLLDELSPNCQKPTAATATMLTVIQNFFISETGLVLGRLGEAEG
jgi:hypothetical protein